MNAIMADTVPSEGGGKHARRGSAGWSPNGRKAWEQFPVTQRASCASPFAPDHSFQRMKALTLFMSALIGAMNLAACSRRSSQAAPAAPGVLVTDATARDVPVYREWIGTLDGSENAEIRARVSGYLVKRNYQEGSLVKKGDLLFEIDPRPTEAALAEAKSQLEQAKAAQVASQADADRSRKELFETRTSAKGIHQQDADE